MQRRILSDAAGGWVAPQRACELVGKRVYVLRSASEHCTRLRLSECGKEAFRVRGCRGFATPSRNFQALLRQLAGLYPKAEGAGPLSEIE